MANRKVNEIVFANLVGDVIGTDNLINAYFNNDTKGVIGSLVTGNNVEEVTALLEKVNYDSRSRNFTGQSNFGEIQQKMVDLYMTSENIELFEQHLVTNEKLLESGIEYRGLVELRDNFDQLKENMPSLQKAA